MTTYLQTVATIIPVLLVAGFLNPEILKRYAETDQQRRWLKLRVAVALTCMSLCAWSLIIFPDPAAMNEPAVRNTLIFISGLGLMFAVGSVWILLEHMLDEKPHLDLLDVKRQELADALTRARRQLEEYEQSGGNNHRGNKHDSI